MVGLISVPKASTIINRNCPILIINESDVNFNSEVQIKLRGNGLVSKTCNLADVSVIRTASRYPLVVHIINTTNNIPLISPVKPRNGRKSKNLILDIDPFGDFPIEKVSYDFEYIATDANADNISASITGFFLENIDPSEFKIEKEKDNNTQKLHDLLSRLDMAADAISDLRINSTSEVVSELRSIRSSLQASLKTGVVISDTDNNEIKKTIYEVLTVVSRVYDCVENSRVAAIIVSGVTTAIMGCSGLSGAVTVAIMLASWHGKDAFIAAVNKISFNSAK